jgi:hypothetical protein
VQAGASMEIGVRVSIGGTERAVEPPVSGDTVYLNWDWSRSLIFPKGSA